MSLQAELASELDAARDLVATMSTACARRNAAILAPMITIVRGFRTVIQARDGSGGTKVTLDLEAATRMLGKVLGR